MGLCSVADWIWGFLTRGGLSGLVSYVLKGGILEQTSCRRRGRYARRSAAVKGISRGVLMYRKPPHVGKVFIAA